MSDNQEINKKGFFKKLMDGDFGLAKTYWLYGVLVNIVLNITLKGIEMSESIGLIIISFLAVTIYSVCQVIGLWNAANRYTGSKVWAVLAKIFVVLGVILIAIATIGLTIGLITL